MALTSWSIGRKLGLISTLLGLPLVLALGFQLKQQAQTVHRLQRQKQGIDSLIGCLKTLVQVQKARGSASALLNGDQSFAAPVARLQEEVSNAFTDLAGLGERGGTGTAASVANVQLHWQALRNDFQRLTPAQSFDRHTVLVSEMLALAKQIRDASGMLSEGSLDQYYLVYSTVEGLPTLTEIVGQLRGRGSGLLARRQLNEESRSQMVALLTALASARAEVERSLQVLYHTRPEFKRRFEAESQQTLAVASNFSDLAQREVLSASPTITAKDYFERGTESIEALMRLSQSLSDQTVTEIDSRLATARRASTALALGVGLLVLVAGWLLAAIIRSITSSLAQAVTISERLAQGDLSGEIQVASHDEVGALLRGMQASQAYFRDMAAVADRLSVGEAAEIRPRSDQDQLSHSFNKMAQNLNQMARVAERLADGDLTAEVQERSERDVLGLAFRNMVEHNRGMLAELIRGVSELSSAASEMAATCTEQSASMAEQASALQQMSATLEELRTMCHQSSEKARSVVGVSEHSLRVSENGQQALTQTLDSMTRIREQIDRVTTSILDLSQKTQQISDITDSVRDIAEQSNLLAVNAAVEASKAGEAGRGFGVVAIEVKSLATQSKKATGTVRTILNEIQQATSSTVMGVEEGNKRVQTGVTSVQQVGEDIRQLYGIIVEACDASRQIASATQQQVTGIEQISQAVRSVSQVASELATATRQQSATAQSLSGLANSLDQIVKHYRLPSAR